MAEASVETSASPRFFCHRCNDEIGRVLPGFKCPRCNSGFIEELELQPQNSFSDESSDGDDVEMVTSIGELLGQNLFSSLRESTSGPDSGNGTSPAPTDSGGNSTSRRRRQAGTFTFPVRSTRRRTNSDRQMPPLENIIQEFIINLSGFDWDPAVMQAQGSPMLMYGNPGDYAFGRAGLDAIITQLLNQMDGTGPPPMAKDKIAEIPTITIEQNQIDENMQCSVCWEDFKLAEPVRKLVCEHLYHTQCIVPWLQLHGTCPICRKALADDSSAESSSASAGPSTSSSMPNPASSSSANTSWLLNTASQSGPRIISSLFGSISNALSGGVGGVSSGNSTSTTAAAAASADATSSSMRSSSADGDDASSQRHPYNLRSRDRTDGDDVSAEDRGGWGRGRGRFQNFEEDYD